MNDKFIPSRKTRITQEDYMKYERLADIEDHDLANGCYYGRADCDGEDYINEYDCSPNHIRKFLANHKES